MVVIAACVGSGALAGNATAAPTVATSVTTDPLPQPNYTAFGGSLQSGGLHTQAASMTSLTVNGSATGNLRPASVGNTLVLVGSGFTSGSQFTWGGPLSNGIVNTAVTYDAATQMTIVVSVSAAATGPFYLWTREPGEAGWSYTGGQVQVYRGEGTFYSLPAAVRVADDRVSLGGRSTPLAPGQTWRIPVGGQNAIPSTAAAVSVNLTAVGGARGGWLALYPAGGSVPGVSSVNFGPGDQVVPNHLIVPLGEGGSLDLFNGSGDNVTALVDIDGYFSGTDTPGGLLYTGYSPRRSLDMRITGAAIGPGETVSLRPQTYSTAQFPEGYVLDANVTITNQTAAGYASVFSGDASSSTVSTHNWVAPRTDTANRVAVRTGPNSTIKVTNGSAGTIQVIVDIFGYYEQVFGYRFVAVPPTRVADTRGTSPLQAHEVRFIGTSSWVTPLPYYLVGNLTGTAPTSSTYFQLWYGTDRQAVSNLNLAAGETRANGFMEWVPTDGSWSLSNAFGSVHAIIDIFGTFNP
jgi:hypothetical protein